ncbi:hypothetical protein KY290_023797 [Solanum tuberosum]|uniref:Pentatricopeptide repeat-containing protein n=1 Tax=Solanum tuberosum TaxID=4113 RepID=A0ABQ7UNV0_SOLTU|nr:hypothetical protein KY290_023797 [Solanum tuberosum]
MYHAHLLFDKIPQPNIVLFNFLAHGYARSDTPLNAFVLFLKILTLGVVPDFYTFPSLLKACAGAEALEEGKQLHCLLIKYGLKGDMYVCPALMNMYIECKDNGSARRVFDRIADPCVVTYNAIIMGYVRSSEPNKALLLFRELQVKKIKPSDVTILGVVSSCALLGTLGFGKWVHEYVKKNGFDQYVKVNTALIDMYAKCGSLADAISVFESMRNRDTQAWSAMIMAYAIHGRARCAITLFQEMQNTQVNPDGITFLGLLYACNHSGLIEEGFRFFNSMKENYMIVPGVKHYGCLLDSLARAGRLTDAFKFLTELPIPPTLLLWRTLLAACSIHGNVDLGKLVLQRIFELDKSHSGDYVIFSNMCARAGKWEEVNYIWKLMKERGIKKIPGCSSVEVNNVLHEFFSGEVMHIEHRELHQEVDKLIEKLKLVGYVPDTSIAFRPGLKDEDKEATLSGHQHYVIKSEVVVIQLLESQHLTLAFIDFGQITTMAPIHQVVITQTSMMRQREGLYINVSCTDENQLYIGRKTDEHSKFKSALTIKEKVNLLSVLKDARIEPGGFYSLEVIKEAVKNGTGHEAAIECNKDALDLINCPILPQRKCNETIEFATFGPDAFVEEGSFFTLSLESDQSSTY